MIITLPSVLSDGMVIGKKANIWGWASPNQSIRAEFLNKTYETSCDLSGRFELTLLAEEFGGPHVLKIEDITLTDVFVGRVWLCGGQSNMETPLSRSRFSLGAFIKDDKRIRVFQAEKGMNFERPQKNVAGKWQTAEGEFLDNMYGVPYFFARSLLEQNGDIPIGLVCVPAGGTPLESWLPEEIIRGYPEIYERLTPLKMPGFIDSTTSAHEKNSQLWQNALNSSDLGLEQSWFSQDYDDSDWDTRVLLDPTGSPSYGSLWLRRTFELEKTGGDVFLNFGRVENSVKVFINGTEILHVTYSYPPCFCKIPNELLNDGKNTIALRIVGEDVRPQLIPGKEYALYHSEGVIDFTQGEWKWKTGAETEKFLGSLFFYNRPCGVYNFMLAPLLGYSIDGLIWYQGESNTDRPHGYKALFAEFAEHMRENFGKNLPIIFTQIANYVDPYSYDSVGGFSSPGAYVAVLREQQRQCLQIPNTAMAVTIDCGEYNDIHPVDKKSVGDRLALHARRMVYGEKIVSDGPIFNNVRYLSDSQKIVIEFKNGVGLWAKNGHPTLMILYKDGLVRSVFAAIRGETLEAPIGATAPRAVRFCWADCPTVPIYNAYGLPASPFEEVIKEMG